MYETNFINYEKSYTPFYETDIDTMQERFHIPPPNELTGIDKLILMPRRDGTGPRGSGRQDGTGPYNRRRKDIERRDRFSDRGRGIRRNRSDKGSGPKTGGRKGNC